MKTKRNDSTKTHRKTDGMPAYVIPGLYPALRVMTCKNVDPVQSRHRIYVIDFEIVKSEVTEREVGSVLTWVTREGPSLQSFLADVLNKPFDDVSWADVCSVFRGDDPLQGLLLRCEAVERVTKSRRCYTYCKWSPIELTVVKPKG